MNIKFDDNDLTNAAALHVGAAHVQHTPAGQRTENAIVRNEWDPLSNTDQALDLAAALKMKIVISEGSICVSLADHSATNNVGNEMGADLRRSIVVVAAGLGEKQSCKESLDSRKSQQ